MIVVNVASDLADQRGQQRVVKFSGPLSRVMRLELIPQLDQLPGGGAHFVRVDPTAGIAFAPSALGRGQYPIALPRSGDLRGQELAARTGVGGFLREVCSRGRTKPLAIGFTGAFVSGPACAAPGCRRLGRYPRG